MRGSIEISVPARHSSRQVRLRRAAGVGCRRGALYLLDYDRIVAGKDVELVVEFTIGCRAGDHSADGVQQRHGDPLYSRLVRILSAGGNDVEGDGALDGGRLVSGVDSAHVAVPHARRQCLARGRQQTIEETVGIDDHRVLTRPA